LHATLSSSLIDLLPDHSLLYLHQKPCILCERTSTAPQSKTMAHTLSHTEVLNCGAQDAWECCKHSDKVLPDLLPQYFSSSEILEGNGGPGTLRVLHFGPGT
jgi:hypothetical protein